MLVCVSVHVCVRACVCVCVHACVNSLYGQDFALYKYDNYLLRLTTVGQAC